MTKVIALLLTVACFGSAWADEIDHAIGTKGATIRVSDNWNRKKLSDDIGKDQFASKDNSFFIVLEFETTLSSQEEFNERITDAVSHGSDANTDIVHQPLISRDGVDHAQTRFNSVLNGLPLAYNCRLIGRDGLYYLIMGWSVRNKAGDLAAEMGRIAETLKMPSADSSWGKEAVPSPVIRKRNGYTLKFDIQRSIFRREDPDDDNRICTITSKDGNTSCHFFVGLESNNVQALSRSVRKTLRGEFPDIKETGRANVDVAGRKGLQISLLGASDGQAMSFIVTLIPLENSRFAEIRFLTVDNIDARKKLMDTVIKSLEVSAPKTVDAFPVAASRKNTATTTKEQQSILKASTLLATIDAGATRIRLLPDGSVIAVGYSTIDIYEPKSASPAQSHEAEDRIYMSQSVSNSKGLWYANRDQQLVRLYDESREVIDCKAFNLASAGGDDLVVIREKKRTPVHGLDQILGSQIILREFSGKERIIKETVKPVAQMSVERSGKNMLFTMFDDWRLRTPDGDATHLSILEIDSGKERVLEPWTSVDDIIGADGRWLVRGQPVHQTPGLYQLDMDGSIRLLVSGGNCLGVALTYESLTIATSLARGDGKTDVYSVPLDVVAKHGKAWQPLYGELLQRIATESFAEAKTDLRSANALTTRKQIDEVFEIARKRCRESTQADLPLDPEGVDLLLSDVARTRGVKKEGAVLLAIMLSECLLEKKAEWVESVPSPLLPERFCDSSNHSNPFIFPVSPGAVIASVLYEEEGWYGPAVNVPDRADGRRVILCNNPDAYAERHFGDDDKILRTMLGKADVDGLTTLLKKHPDNTHLRKLAYESLLPNVPIDNVERIAQNFVAQETPIVDLQVILSAQSAKAGAKECPELIGKVTSAISRFPEERALYLILGDLYEKSGGPDAADCAVACYNKVLDLGRYGNLADEAEARLKKIGNASSNREQ